MVDRLNKEMRVGDKVVYLHNGKNCGEFRVGIITGFTPKMVKIQTENNKEIRKLNYYCIVDR